MYVKNQWCLHFESMNILQLYNIRLTMAFLVSTTFHFSPCRNEIHKICPVHKVVYRSNVKKYRPIFLLCIVSKVLKPIVDCKIIPFIKLELFSVHYMFSATMFMFNSTPSFYVIVYEVFHKSYQPTLTFLHGKKPLTRFPNLSYCTNHGSWLHGSFVALVWLKNAQILQ